MCYAGDICRSSAVASERTKASARARERDGEDTNGKEEKEERDGRLMGRYRQTFSAPTNWRIIR